MNTCAVLTSKRLKRHEEERELISFQGVDLERTSMGILLSFHMDEVSLDALRKPFKAQNISDVARVLPRPCSGVLQ